MFSELAKTKCAFSLAEKYVFGLWKETNCKHSIKLIFILTKNTLKNWLIASSSKKSKETIKVWPKHHLQALGIIMLPVGVSHFALCLVKPQVPSRRLSATGHRRPTTPTHLEN